MEKHIHAAVIVVNGLERCAEEVLPNGVKGADKLKLCHVAGVPFAGVYESLRARSAACARYQIILKYILA